MKIVGKIANDFYDFLRAAGVDVPAGPVYVNPAEIAAALVESEPIFRAE